MELVILKLIFVFLFGLAIGSFLNCVIYRLKSGDSLGGHSFCPHCQHRLAWYDLIPLISFLILKGRCRYCEKSISLQYPLVEIATGLLVVFSFLRFYPIQAGLELISFSLVVITLSFLVVIFVYDLKHYVIPNTIIYPAILSAFTWLLVESLLIQHSSGLLLEHLLAAILSFAFFLSIYLISRGKSMGFGDVRYTILMGFLLGQETLVALFLSFVLGAIIGLGLMLLGKKGRKAKIPFAPFLVIGTIIAFFYGNLLINWYFNTFLFV